MKHRLHAAGLTLLELVMALAVLAVLGTLALPNVGAQLEHQRLRDAAQTLAGDIAEARFLAAQRGQPVHLQAEAGAAACWTVALEPGCGCGGAPAACGVVTRGPGQLRRTRLLNPLQLQLEASGSPNTPTTPGSATFESPQGEQLRVDITALGRTRICALVGYWPQIPACS